MDLQAIYDYIVIIAEYVTKLMTAIDYTGLSEIATNLISTINKLF